MHLVLLTRRDPSLQLKELRVHDRLTELRMQDLAFTVPEIMCLFRQSHGIELTEHTAKTIHNKTEGWIVGLRLASLAIKNPEDTEVVLAKLKSDFFTSSDFLMEEVMQNQSPEIQKLLLATSLCNRFCSELVDNIRQKGDMTLKSMTGDEFIQWLKTSNLFLVSLDFDNKWYRYHHLFQELLLKQLNNRYSAHEVNEIQRQIAQWHESRGDIDEAIEYFCLAGDAVAAAEIVEKKAHDVFLHGVYLVETWLKKIPQNIKETRPLLLLIEAWHAFGQFQLEKIPPILEKVQSIVNKDNDSPRLQAEISFFQGNFMYWMGETESSIQMLSNALNLAVGLPTHVKSNIELVLNLALQKSGHYETVVNELQRKIHATEKSEGFYLSYVYGSLTFVHLLQGKLLAAADAAYKMQINSSKIKSNYLLGWAYYLHASADFSTFKLKESLALFTLARAYRYSIDLRVTLDVMVSSALIHYFYHDQKQSFQILKELTDYTAELNDPPSMLIAQSAKARLDLLTGNNSNAFQWAETFTMPPMFAGIFFWMEVPWITKAKILIAKGNADSLEIVLALLQELLELVVSSNLDYHKVEILMLLAITYEKLKHTDEALKYIEQAVSLADKQVCVRPFIEAEKSLQPLLIKLSEQGTANEFISKLISIRNDIKNETYSVVIPYLGQSSVDPSITLTEREQETLVLLAEGLRNKEIANKLFVSESTIKRHVYNMCQKLNTKSRVELINKAKAMGFFN